MPARSFSLCAALALGLVSSRSAAGEWTRFRGPNGRGHAEAPHLPSHWEEADLDWRIELPGMGHSQPVVWEDRVFVTCAPADGSERRVVCVEAASGKLLWKRAFPSRDYHLHQRNSHASSTPAVDADRLYVAQGHEEEIALLALDHEGRTLWRRPLGPFRSQHGLGASPILFENLVVFPCVQGEEGKGFVIALDRRTGEVVWKTPRRASLAAYSTPCLHEGPGGRPRLLLSSQAHGISALDARTGRPIWEAVVFDKRAVSSPVVAGGLVFGTCGSGGGGNYVVAVRPGGTGDVTRTHVAYEIRKAAPYVPTPLPAGDRLYLWSGFGGIVTSLEPASGRVVWRERAGGNYYGSPILVGDRIFSISERGEVVVISAADTFRVLGRTSLGEPSRSTPAVSGGRMFLRTFGHLMAVGGKFLRGSK